MSFMAVPVEQRFWRYVDKNGAVAAGMTTPCWMWTASTDRVGYGHISRNGRLRQSHRVSWELTRGQIPAGMNVLHRCDVRACVNPDHLFIGTQGDNVHDMMTKGRMDAFGGVVRRGERASNVKLTEADVLRIDALLRSGMLQRRIAALYGVQHNCISQIKRRIVWKHLFAAL